MIKMSNNENILGQQTSSIQNRSHEVS